MSSKKYKSPEGSDESFFSSYSTLKFTGDDAADDGYVARVKTKAPKRSASDTPSQYFKLEQDFDGQHVQFASEVSDEGYSGQQGGHKPSGKFTKAQKSPVKLFQSTEDDYKDSEFFDFSIRPRPGQSAFTTAPSGKYGKLKSDLGVKALTIKSHKNKFDPQLQGGFEPSFLKDRLRDFPNLHGADVGTGIASNGQIQKYFDKEDDRLKHKLLNDPNPAAKAQYAQFIRAKEDERLEKLVEEQFKLQQQKQIAQEKEAELNHQRQQLQRQKEKIKAVEKHLNNKVSRQVTRQKRRPNSTNSRRQRNPSYGVGNGGQASLPMRAVAGKDGTYRVSFNI